MSAPAAALPPPPPPLAKPRLSLTDAVAPAAAAAAAAAATPEAVPAPPESPTPYTCGAISARRRLLYIDVVDDGTVTSKYIVDQELQPNPLDDSEFLSRLEYSDVSFQPGVHRFSRFHVQQAFKMMGCKLNHAKIMTEHMFDAMTTSQFLEHFDALSTGVRLPLRQFTLILRHIFRKFEYNRKNTVVDFCIAASLNVPKMPLIILLGGTSGCGKSTLASLLAGRLGITNVISTDSVRHMLRDFVNKNEHPALFASTYHAGESITDESLTPSEKTIEGYTRQAKLVAAQLDSIFNACVLRRESVIIEGVHLQVPFMTQVMQQYRFCIPFVIYISNPRKHQERFAVRARYMTLKPSENRYIKYFENIRVIQNRLVSEADEALVPKIDNTNVDRSLAAMHAIILSCLRHLCQSDEPLYNPESRRSEALHRMFGKVERSILTSKDMYELLRAKERTWAWPPDPFQDDNTSTHEATESTAVDYVSDDDTEVSVDDMEHLEVVANFGS